MTRRWHWQKKDASKLYEDLLLKSSLSAEVKAKVFNDLGVISYSLGDLVKAENLFKKALFTDTLLEEAYRNLIQIGRAHV